MNEILKYLIVTGSNLRDALIRLNNLSNDVLTLFVVDQKHHLVGSLTDGDIRRALINGNKLEDSINSVYNPNFKFVVENQENVYEIANYRKQGIVLLPCLNSQKEIIQIFNLKKRLSIIPIDTVLMAGGKGERLRPLTEKIPKPLVQIGKKPIIDYHIDKLILYGIENIWITVNYLAEQIEKHFELEREGIKIKCIRESKYLGTIGSTKLIKSFHNDVLMVMNSDIFTNIDIEDFYIFFLKSKADMLVATVPYSISIPYGIFEIDDDQKINAFIEKPTFDYYANAGIYLIKCELINLIPEDILFNATDFMELLIKKGLSVKRYPLIGYWLDIGKYEDYKKAQELIQHITI